MKRKKKIQSLLTDWDIIRSITSWEVSEEAKEKGFLAAVAAADSSSAEMSSSMVSAAADGGGGGGARALEIWRAETLQERERNSIGSRGVSGGLYMWWSWALSMAERGGAILGERAVESSWSGIMGCGLMRSLQFFLYRDVRERERDGCYSSRIYLQLQKAKLCFNGY